MDSIRRDAVFFRSAGARRLGGCAQLPFDRRQAGLPRGRRHRGRRIHGLRRAGVGEARFAAGFRSLPRSQHRGAGFMACAGPEAERPALRRTSAVYPAPSIGEQASWPAPGRRRRGPLCAAGGKYRNVQCWEHGSQHCIGPKAKGAPIFVPAADAKTYLCPQWCGG